ncbi:Uncharacterized protein dnl_57060 [Desulfonema limicola]|uniref:Uncharacterized protein n=1 Tax=Desulfonema limicola TaxID=45656 RepID=A0A975GJD9_9BACT|nr:hypothetical protein [Desulfonema limicola]QTA83307.1 Uncharacterized protein dnl_57060 [Desulfonema limicola]
MILNKNNEDINKLVKYLFQIECKNYEQKIIDYYNSRLSPIPAMIDLITYFMKPECKKHPKISEYSETIKDEVENFSEFLKNEKSNKQYISIKEVEEVIVKLKQLETTNLEQDEANKKDFITEPKQNLSDLSRFLHSNSDDSDMDHFLEDLKNIIPDFKVKYIRFNDFKGESKIDKTLDMLREIKSRSKLQDAFAIYTTKIRTDNKFKEEAYKIINNLS